MQWNTTQPLKKEHDGVIYRDKTDSDNEDHKV